MRMALRRVGVRLTKGSESKPLLGSVASRLCPRCARVAFGVSPCGARLRLRFAWLRAREASGCAWLGRGPDGQL